jgi:hypothetical protein
LISTLSRERTVNLTTTCWWEKFQKVAVSKQKSQQISYGEVQSEETKED